MSRFEKPPLDMLNLSHEEKERLNHETRGPAAYIIMFTFYALTVVFVSVRLFVRLRISRYAGLDDWLIIPSEVESPISLLHDFIRY